MLQTVYL